MLNKQKHGFLRVEFSMAEQCRIFPNSFKALNSLEFSQRQCITFLFS